MSEHKDAEVVELMDLEPDNIHIASLRGTQTVETQDVASLQSRCLRPHHKAMIEAKIRLEFKREGDGDE